MSAPPARPTGPQCDGNALIEWGTQRGLAAWYPQMGGYASACVIEPNQGTECFDCYVWHDGEFTFAEGEAPRRLHHCDPVQFHRFGLVAQEAKRRCVRAAAVIERVADRMRRRDAILISDGPTRDLRMSALADLERAELAWESAMGEGP